MRPDAELLHAWSSGDVSAGNELFQRNFATLYRFFANKSYDAIDDLVQETMVRALRSASKYRGEASFAAWLCGIARYVLLDHLRGRKPEQLQPELDSVAALGTTPSQHALRNEEARLLTAALRHLPIDQQITLELTYWEGFSGAEVAEILGVSPHTVRSRLARARESLETEIRRMAHTHAAVSTLEHLDRWAAEIKQAVDMRSAS